MVSLQPDARHPGDCHRMNKLQPRPPGGIPTLNDRSDRPSFYQPTAAGAIAKLGNASPFLYHHRPFSSLAEGGSMPSNGTITQVIGSTFDAQFPENDLPDIYNAVTVTS